MSGQGVSAVEQPSVSSVQSDEASALSPAEEGMLKSSVVPGEIEQVALPAKEDMLKPSVVPGQEDHASESSPAKEDRMLKPSVISGEEDHASDASPIKEMSKPLAVSGEDDQGYNALPAKEGMVKSSVVPDASPAKEGQMLNALVVSRQDGHASYSSAAKEEEVVKPSGASCQIDQAPDASPGITKDIRKMGLLLHCDPNGSPYECSDFLESIAKLGLYHEVAAIGPQLYRKVWLVKLKTTEALRALVTTGSMRVKGYYCAIVDPDVPEVSMRVHWVPFHISNASLGEALQEFGTVKEVSCYMWSWDEGIANTHTRYVRLCLKEGLQVKDLPYLWHCQDEELLIVIPGRPPMCLKCSTIGHFRRYCKVPQCRTCKKYGHKKCKRLCHPETGNVQRNETVHMKPVKMPVTPAAEPVIDDESERQQGTAPAAKETTEQPHKALTEDEPVTGNVQVNKNVPTKPGAMLVTPTALREIEQGSENQQGTPPVPKEKAECSHEVLTGDEPLTCNSHVDENVSTKPQETLLPPTSLCVTEHGSESQQGTPPVAKETTAQLPDEALADSETGSTD